MVSDSGSAWKAMPVSREPEWVPLMRTREFVNLPFFY